MTRKVNPSGDVTTWSITQLKRFLKNRKVSVKHYKERSLLEEDVAYMIANEAQQDILNRLGMIVALLCVSAITYVIILRNRKTINKILCLNPKWVKWRLLEYGLQVLSTLNLINVICSWILPPQWNLVRVYFWDYFLPDIG